MRDVPHAEEKEYDDDDGVVEALSDKSRKSKKEKRKGKRKGRHQKNNSSMFGGFIGTPRTPIEFESTDNRDPSEGLRGLMCQIIIMICLILTCLGAATGGCLEVSGDVGITEIKWNYGYGGKTIKKNDDIDDIKDLFTKYAARDAGSCFLFSLVTGFFTCVFALLLLCTRWQSGYVYYNQFCGFRFFHRQTLNVLFGFLKQYMWMAMVWYVNVNVHCHFILFCVFVFFADFLLLCLLL